MKFQPRFKVFLCLSAENNLDLRKCSELTGWFKELLFTNTLAIKHVGKKPQNLYTVSSNNPMNHWPRSRNGTARRAPTNRVHVYSLHTLFSILYTPLKLKTVLLEGKIIFEVVFTFGFHFSFQGCKHCSQN